MDAFILVLLATLWALVIYHHVGYPLALSIIKRKLRPSTCPSHLKGQELPRIVMLVPAYNEQDVIADKIRNAAMLDYPGGRFEMVIVCDGCTDDTAQVAHNTLKESEVQGLNAKVVDFEENQGKVAVLNHMIPQLNADIIALSDASALLSIDGLNVAAARFRDSNVGVVAATYKLLNPGSAGEARYWQYQTEILNTESCLGSPIGVHGALYFLRHALFKPIAPDTINDDFLLPMSVVADGYRAIYEPNIVALELEQATDAMDQKRRIRISAGNLQQVLRLPKLLNPMRGGIAFAFASGKVLRGLMPLILFLQIALCFWLAQTSLLFFAAAISQVVVILFAAFVPNLTAANLPASLNTICYLVNGYRCGFIGSVRYLLGLERGHWKSVSPKETQS